MRRNLKKIEETAAKFEVRTLLDPKEIRALADDMARAYNAQYAKAKVQWLPMNADYFREMAGVPGTEVTACWDVSEGRRQFAGFILNLGDQFNHRMGIHPEYSHHPGEEDSHLVYQRLTYENIRRCIEEGQPRKWLPEGAVGASPGADQGMWIAQSTYEAKARLGFQFDPLFNFRRGAVPGLRWFVEGMYDLFMSDVHNPSVHRKF